MQTEDNDDGHEKLPGGGQIAARCAGCSGTAAAVLGETLDQVLAELCELSPGLKPAKLRWNTDRGARQNPAGDPV